MRAIALDRPIELEAVRGGDRLEAVVLPAAPGELVVESKGRVERLALSAPGRVMVPIRKGAAAIVSFTGGEALLHAPRIVRGDAPPAARPGGAPRRILFVVADTLRADAVTAETMPELLRFFAGGARFTRAFSAATWTLPSMASLFTGKPPSSLALPDGTLIALAAGEPTLASDLSAGGFHTVGVSGNYAVHHENGFSSGFELYVVPTILGHGEWPDATWVLDHARRAIEWFPDRDLFLYLHLMDPHDPYRNHETGDSLPVPVIGESIDRATVERARAAYASEARRLSRLVAEFLEEAGPFERVVFTADHGEEFLEHGGFGHGSTVYPEVSRVPLLVRGPGVPAGDFEAPVSLTALRSYLAGADASLLDPGMDVMVESHVHAPPRFSWVHDDGQVVLFARELGLEGEPGVGDAEAKPDPIGVWLRRTHPAIEFLDRAGRPRAAQPGEAWAAAVRLAERFRGLRAGWWLLVPPDVERLALQLGGAEEGLWWGAAGTVRFASDAAAPGQAVLEVERPDPFALVFVAGAEVSVRALDGGGDAPLETSGPPSDPGAGRAGAWRDPGRPPAEHAGIEETLQRLRAQGYL